MTRLRTACHALLAGLTLLATPLFAQLNPASAWQKSATDFNQLYQGTASKAGKPEVLMVLDYSPSMAHLMFHPLFPNNWADEYPRTIISDRTGDSTGQGNSSNSKYYNLYVQVAAFTASNDSKTHYRVSQVGVGIGTFGNTIDVGGTTGKYTIGGTRIQANGSAVANTSTVTTTQTNTLIKPDGTEVTEADVLATVSNANLYRSTVTATTLANYAMNWVRMASHLRMRCTYGGVTRDVDIPLNWTVLTTKNADGSFYTGTAPSIVKALNPKNNTYYDVDLTYQSTTTPDRFAYLRENNTDPTQAEIGVSVGTTFGTGTDATIALYRSRYLEWIFWGKRNATTYCIPNAVNVTGGTTPTSAGVLNCVDPASLNAYDPGSQTYTITTLTGATRTAYTNGLPARARVQAVREAIVKTWMDNQDAVFMAYRYLNVNTSYPVGTSNIATPTSGTTPPVSTMEKAPPEWTYITDVATLMNYAATDFNSIGGTPLTVSQFSAYTQMTGSTAFSTPESAYTSDQLGCQDHYVILFTDGAPSETTNPNEGAVGTYFPYVNGSAAGNAAVKTAPGNLNGGNYWNSPTLAGIAAHGGEAPSGVYGLVNPALVTYPTATNQGPYNNSLTSSWLPFWVKTRGSTNLTAKPIQTMTFGVSLGVNYTVGNSSTYWPASTMIDDVTTSSGSVAVMKPLQSDLYGAKYRLMMTALCGDPSEPSPTPATADPFWMDPNTGKKATTASYFFDGSDPDSLVDNLKAAFNAIQGMTGNASTAAPVFPTIGAGLGAEVYLSMFVAPDTAGPVWPGDLLMYPTKDSTTSNGTITNLIDSSGAVVSGNLSTISQTGWAASSALANRGWNNRTIYTRMPATSGTPAPALIQISMGSDGATGNANYTTLSTILPGATVAAKLQNWQFFAGANTADTASPKATRSNIMGDIINSAPITLEYTTLPTSITATVSPNLYAAWGAHAGAHFRVIFTGTNQGFLHAFGEVSWTDTATNPTVPITKGVVDELWAFAPTDIIPYISQFTNTANKKHQFAVDGAPTVYLLDVPQTSYQTTGNGKYDSSITTPERASVVFGLGKGGRSYYAIDIRDPVAPSLKWTICPDEPYSYQASRIVNGDAANTITRIANMGLSTCVPTIARVATARIDATKPNLIIDVCLLGGGYSDTNIEAALPGSPAGPATGTKLGRSALAVDMETGNIVGSWDLDSTAGSVSAGVVPHQMIEGSGLNQRAYFCDYYGGLWALGSTTMRGTESGVDYSSFRQDSAKIDTWTARKVYWQQVTAGAAGDGVISTLPVPFNLPYFPVIRTVTPKVAPAAVGIAFVTGDRNDPLDYYTPNTVPSTAWTQPSRHRLDVVFDRDDVNTVKAATDLVDASTLTTTTMDTSNAAYYLIAKTGYYINFPSPITNTAPPPPVFVPKGIVSPLVLNGTIFYSYFTPTNATCAGGAGVTDTFRVCNLMRPAVVTTDASGATAIAGCQSGRVLDWTGVASNMSIRSILSGIQAGMTSGSGTSNNASSSSQSLKMQSLSTQGSETFAKIRVWRTVH